MRLRWFLLPTLILAGSAAGAQGSRPAAAPVSDVVVTGVRSKLSGWREAETAHVIVQSDGGEAELVRLIRNLERLHFLLSGLMGRTGAADDTIKLRITLIGDVPEFAAMDLRNQRWQQGPFNDAFALTRYYDPREDGAVMATTRVDQVIRIARTTATADRVLGTLSAQSLNTVGGAPAPGSTAGGNPADAAALQGALIGGFATSGMRGPHDLTVSIGDGGGTIPVTAESLLYAGYAQHYLQTSFPAAYPRWYLDGFGQIFASLAVRDDGVLEFGRSPRGTSAVLHEFGTYPLAAILDDSYLGADPRRTGWTPVHAWLLTHFLFFSDTRRPQLRQYLTARANGADAAAAAAVFGDPRQLARELQTYFGTRKPYEQVTYRAAGEDQPLVRRLTEGEAAFVKGRLELGARVLMPPRPAAGADRAVVKAYDEALSRRERWLGRLRADAGRWPNELGAQLLLAEAECRSGHADGCLAAATRAQAIAPADARPLTWRGAALAQQAAALPLSERATALAEARRSIAAANRLDLEAVEPLLAYYRSFAVAGEAPSVAAIDGLQKAMAAVPDAPATRLALAAALADRGETGAARIVVLPVAKGAYDSPERPAARALLARIAAPPGGTASGAMR